MGEDWMAIMNTIMADSGRRLDIEKLVEQYLDYRVEEPTEEEIHAERSERFIDCRRKTPHIVCPFEGYEELHKDDDICGEEEDDDFLFTVEEADDGYYRTVRQNDRGRRRTLDSPYGGYYEEFS